MTKNQRSPLPSSNQPEVVAAPADQILHWLQKVANHDLPNQLLAVRGWVTLLQTEEMENLTESGRNLVQRLIHASEKAQHTVALIAEFARLSTTTHRIENLSILSLIPDVQRAAEERTGAVKIDWELSVKPVNIRADGRLLVRVLSEIVAVVVRYPANGATPRAHSIQVGAEQQTGGVGVWVKANNEILEKDVEKRLEYLFAHEAAQLFGGTFTIQTADGEPDCFLFQFPGYTATV